MLFQQADVGNTTLGLAPFRRLSKEVGTKKLLGLLIAAASCVAFATPVRVSSAVFTTADGGGQFRMQVSQNGVDMTNASIVDIFCVDYLNGTYVPGSIYEATFTNLTSSSLIGGYLPNTRYGRASSPWNSGTDPSLAINFLNSTIGGFTPNVLDRYRMAGLLATQYQVGNQALNNSINRAIWQITAITPPPGEFYPWGNYPTDASTPTWLNWAGSRLSNMYSTMSVAQLDGFFADYRVITQTNPLYLAGQIPSQEFLTINPEPGFFVALVLGVGGLMFVAMRRQAAAVKA